MSVSGLSVVVIGEPNPTVVLSGELDLTSMEILKSVVPRLNHPPRSVTLDLRGVPFVDVAGLRALSDAVASMLAAGHDVSLIPSQSVTWLMGKLDAAGCPITLGAVGRRLP